MRKLSHREAKSLAIYHTANQQSCWNAGPGSETTVGTLTAPAVYCPTEQAMLGLKPEYQEAAGHVASGEACPSKGMRRSLQPSRQEMREAETRGTALRSVFTVQCYFSFTFLYHLSPSLLNYKLCRGRHLIYFVHLMS